MKKTALIAFLVACSFGTGAFARGGHGGGHGSTHTTYGSGSHYSSGSYSSGSTGSHAVGGYTRSNGTYVAPHHATNPDSSRSNNWSTQGNMNPYTGQMGTKRD